MRSSSPGGPPRSSSAWPFRARGRRNSEGSVPTLAELSRGRGSLSVPGNHSKIGATDAMDGAAMRKGVDEFLTANPSRIGGRTAGMAKVDTAAMADEAKSRRRSTQSRPPLAFYNSVNKTYHHRTWSLAQSPTAFPRSFVSGDEDVLLKPPAPRIRSASINSTAAAFAPAAPAKTTAAAFPLQPWSLQDNIPLAMYRPEDREFVLRTQRASAKIQQITDSYSSSPPREADMEPVPMTRAPQPPPQTPQTPAPAYPEGSPAGLGRPDLYNRPRRLSNSSTVSTVSSVVSTYDSFDGQARSSISMASSQTSIESWPNSPAIGPRQPGWQMQGGGVPGQPWTWNRPAPIKTYRRKAQPGELFAALPSEVLALILDHLAKLHLGPGTTSCATCWMRDCCSAALSARKMLKPAREALYKNIILVGQDGPHMKKRTKLSYGARLVLLRRTLRANPEIAGMVRSLKPPALPPGVGVVEYNDLVASVVMACPKLERLAGYYPAYAHQHQRLFHALSTRTELKEMDWNIDPWSNLRQQQRNRPAGSGQLWAPGELHPQQAQDFLDYHLGWGNLTTLVVHCNPGATLAPTKLLYQTIRCLPSLQKLFLSHLPAAAFDDAVLLSLPALHTLSLSHLPGVTTNGLSSLATRASSASLVKLTLIHMHVKSLPTVARLLSHLHSLESLSIVQAEAPIMPPDELVLLFPYLASHTLRTLHWDIPYLPSSATTADAMLARSIAAGGFPQLRILRAPNDPEGLFQRLCLPRERVDGPTDRYKGGQAHYGSSSPWGHTRNASSYSTISYRSSSAVGGAGSAGGAPGLFTPPASPLFPPDALLLPRENSDLHQARLAAQARLEAARRFPRFMVNVYDEQGIMVEKFGVGAFLGSVESKIRYVLTPDAESGGTDERGGLVGVEDMFRDDGGEALVLGGSTGYGGDHSGRDSAAGKRAGNGKKERKGSDREDEGGDPKNKTRTREGCIGRWNTYSGAVLDKKDKERWWHQERGRWKGVVLS